MKSNQRRHAMEKLKNVFYLTHVPAKHKSTFGVLAANKAVLESELDSTLIYLTVSEYQDLCSNACVAELKKYKGKTIMIISDPKPDFMSLI